MFLNDITEFTPQDYDLAQQRLESYCESLEGLVLFGIFGQASEPSISDLDTLICFEDIVLVKSQKAIEAFIRSDPLLTYCHEHPLIISRSMLPYLQNLHSLYNLEITYNPEAITLSPADIDQQYLLNLLWVTFLLPIALRIMKFPQQQGIRFVLQVLKNLQQACENLSEMLGEKKEFRSSGLKIRKAYLQGRAVHEDIYKLFQDAVCNLLELMDRYQIHRQDQTEPCKLNSRYCLNRSTEVRCSQSNGFNFHGNALSLQVTSVYYSLVEQVDDKNCLSTSMKQYLESFHAVNMIYDQLGFEGQRHFVTPFLCRIDSKTTLINRIKRLIINLICFFRFSFKAKEAMASLG